VQKWGSRANRAVEALAAPLATVDPAGTRQADLLASAVAARGRVLKQPGSWPVRRSRRLPKRPR
jgi:hypothetical protein